MAQIQCPATARRDEETPLVLTDLPEQKVTVVAKTADFCGGARSRQVFDATDCRVDTSSDAPVEGDYDTVAPMGWLWAMTPTDEEATTPAHDGEVTIDLSVQVDGETLATATTTRLPADGGVSVESVDATVVGTLARPSGDGPHPGVVVLHGSGGEPMTDVARLLASRGFTALALRWFGPGAPTDEPANVPLSYVGDAAEWLTNRGEVSDGDVAVWGISKGGEVALAAAAYLGAVGPTVAVSASGLMMPGEPTDSATVLHNGDTHPSLSPPDAPAPSDGWAMTEMLLDATDEEAIDAATIAVERATGPVLLLVGDDDPVWNAARLTEPTVERLAAGDVPHERVVYEDAGHSLVPPCLPTATGAGGTPAGNAAAMADAWERTLSTLRASSGRTD